MVTIYTMSTREVNGVDKQTMLATTINDHSTTVTGIDEQGDVGDDERHKSHSKGQETTQARNGTKRRNNTSKKWGKEGGTMHDKSRHM